jgi:quercetin dioxygenase-like cupin family protein
MSKRFEDERGVIEDLLGSVDSVTHISTRRGAVRGNHFHKETTQWTYLLSGRLRMANSHYVADIEPGSFVTHPPGEPHAWKALEHSACLVFTKGPRSGENYEADTHRLDEPLLT